MDALAYIQDAAAAEENMDIERAYEIAFRGYIAFPDNYELIFMLGGYKYYMGQFEAAYVYHLLSESLCGTEDLAIIAQNRAAIDTDVLDVSAVQETLAEVIQRRMNMREYEGTYKFVSYLLFSDDRFLFRKVCDVWLRYYLIILEITACERNRQPKSFTADRYADWHGFEDILREFKFAFRRIWFGFPEEKQSYLSELVEKYDVSAEFVVIMGKYAVHAAYLADALKKAASLLSRAGKSYAAEIVLRYAVWFSGVQNPNLPVLPILPEYDNGMEIISVNAADRNAFAKQRENVRREETVSYIMCANDDHYVNEALLFLRRQKLPADGKMTVYIIYHAPSMTAGYNIGMKLSSAAYKIYIHQDTFIFDEKYTEKIIAALKTSDYRMLGIGGTAQLPPSGRWWDSRPGDMHLRLYQDFVINVIDSSTEKEENEFLLDLESLDGVLMAAADDIPWREDLFTGFHFYDISQSYEFKKRGKKTGFFHNTAPGGGVLHEVSVSKNPAADAMYEAARETFCAAYLQPETEKIEKI